jgi:hypothetical protein
MAAPPRVGNPFGVVALVLGIALVVLGIVTRVLAYAAPSIAAATHASAASVGVLFTVTGVLGLLLGIAAAILGIVGVTRPGLPHALAAAGMAVGIFSVVSWLVGTVSTPLIATIATHR